MNKNEVNYKVLVSCMTFNQSRYIVDAMNGFCMQETSFPFICVIMDDASTDGEQEVIDAYLKENFDLSCTDETAYALIASGQHKTNRNCYFIVYYLKENHYSQKKDKKAYLKNIQSKIEYIALCEGDDYWTDSSKLQKQADFLDNNPDYTAVYTTAILLDNDGTQRPDRFCDSKEDMDLPAELMIEGGGGIVRTVSDMHRIEVMKDYPDFATKCMVGDYPLHIFLSLKGKCRLLVKPMVVYRINAVGSWTASKKRRTIENEIAVRQNFNDMLDGFDQYSNWKYHNSVIKTETYEVYDLLLRNKEYWKKISLSFPKVTPHFRGMVKVDNYLMTHHLSYLYNILWNIRVWRGKRHH